MARGVNKVILVGNLGKDPEVRYVQSGKAVCTLRLAMSENRKDGDSWKEHTEWMDVVLWEKNAENAGQYLAKGRQVYVEGRLQTRQYKDKEGHDRYKTEVVANQLLFLGGQGQGQGGERGPAKPRPASGPPAEAGGEDSPPPEPSGGGFIDDDLPF